jgi:hypothetical protein
MRLRDCWTFVRRSIWGRTVSDRHDSIDDANICSVGRLIQTRAGLATLRFYTAAHRFHISQFRYLNTLNTHQRTGAFPCPTSASSKHREEEVFRRAVGVLESLVEDLGKGDYLMTVHDSVVVGLMIAWQWLYSVRPVVQSSLFRANTIQLCADSDEARWRGDANRAKGRVTALHSGR